jgi:hypothetical protein
MSNEVPFFSQTAVLDRYIRSSNPTENPKALAVVIEVLRTRDDLRRWFFVSRPHPQWAKILLENGFLEKAPEPIVSDGMFFLPRWDAQDYLISIASEVPDVVLAHFERIRTNKHYLRRAVEALCLIPPQQANQVVPILLECVTDSVIAYTIAEPTFELMKKLAQANFADSAFDLFETLPEPQPSPRAKTAEAEILSGYVFNAEAVSFLPPDVQYENQYWTPALEVLAGLNLKRLITMLERQFIQALRVEAETGGRQNEKPRYSFWRQAIEDSGQDTPSAYKHYLLKWLRDFLKRLAGKDPDEALEFIDGYLISDYEILRRLGIYLSGQFPKQYIKQVRDILLNVGNMDETGIHHEYFKLLEYGFPHLELEDQLQLEQMILAGPVPEELVKVASWAAEARDQDPVEYTRVYSQTWKRDRLWMIREHLHEEGAALLHELLAEFGEPEHPDFTSWFTGVRAVTTISPASTDEIGAMPLQELLKYLREWKPGDRLHRFEEERYSELGRVVAQVVFSDYEKYGDYISAIARLNPAYAMSFINHPPSSTFSSDQMLRIKLSLSEELLKDQAIRTDSNRGREGGWIGFRFAIVYYLGKLFDTDNQPIPVDELPGVRDLLILLTDDPDPTPDVDQPAEGWVGHKDPATIAVNHVRPEALSTLIRYASYKARLDMTEDHRGFGLKRMELEVEQALTRKVNYHVDRSTAVHSIFGKYFNLLCWLNWDWANEHLEEVFPEGGGDMSFEFFAASWDSFVVFNPQIYSPVFSLLRRKYKRAIELTKKGGNTQTHLDPVGHLAAHLAVDYLYADENLISPESASSLLARFFKDTSAQSRATAAHSAVDVFTNTPKDEENSGRFWQRIRALWQWRLEEAASCDYPSDFDGEMQAFSRLLSSAARHESAASLWPLIEGMLHYIARSDRRDYVWMNFEDYLLLEVERDPVKAIQIFRLMHDQIKSSPYYYRDVSRKIIEIGARHIESRSETLLLIEQIARLGNYSFKGVYDQYAKR